MTMDTPEAPASSDKGAKPAAESRGAAWYAVWTRSHCEQLVSDQLAPKGIRLFLPKATVWSRRGRTKKRVQMPLFPGYVFVHHALDRESHVEILKARGVVRVLGDRPDAVTAIPEHEMTSVQRLVHTDMPFFPHRHFNDGDRVRITAGPLEGLEGVFLRSRPNKGLLLIAVTLLQRSVAVEVDCTDVQPV
jgi:transcription antitermination factor NusG